MRGPGLFGPKQVKATSMTTDTVVRCILLPTTRSLRLKSMHGKTLVPIAAAVASVTGHPSDASFSAGWTNRMVGL